MAADYCSKFPAIPSPRVAVVGSIPLCRNGYTARVPQFFRLPLVCACDEAPRRSPPRPRRMVASPDLGRRPLFVSRVDQLEKLLTNVLRPSEKLGKAPTVEDDVRGAEHLDLAQQEALLRRAMAPANSVAAVPSSLSSFSADSDELVEVRHCGVVEGVCRGSPGTSPVLPNLIRRKPPILHPVEVRAIHGPGQKMRCLQTHSVVMGIRRPSFSPRRDRPSPPAAVGPDPPRCQG